MNDNDKEMLRKYIRKELEKPATNTMHGIMNQMLRDALKTDKFDNNPGVDAVIQKYGLDFK